MPMVPFFEFFPDVAPSETRVITMLHDEGPVPRGEYGFIESYCNDPGCDCQNVIINIMDLRARHLATINHSLDRRWHERAGVPRTFLDPLNVQGPHAEAFLDIFKEVVRDASYAKRLERHRAMVREVVDAGKARVAAREMLKSVRVERNAPCACGSGRKYKKCCGLVSS